MRLPDNIERAIRELEVETPNPSLWRCGCNTVNHVQNRICRQCQRESFETPKDFQETAVGQHAGNARLHSLRYAVEDFMRLAHVNWKGEHTSGYTPRTDDR